ncbi:MAG: hypothetical protein GY767_14050 [Shimia sp.]|nr:hypothetical protein [Shimia sp.]
MSDYRTLADLAEEFDPQGRKLEPGEKEGLVGRSFLIEKVKPYTGKFGQSVHVVMVDMESGERINTSFGSGVRDRLEDYAEHLPFVATLTTLDTANGVMYLFQ